MAIHLFNKFAKGTALRLIKADWLNKVASLWNYARGGHLINVEIPDNPGPDNGPRWDLDINRLDAELVGRGFSKSDASVRLAPNAVNKKNGHTDDDTKQDVAKFAPSASTDSGDEPDNESDDDKIKRIGKSHTAARADHSHPSELVPMDDENYGAWTLAGWDGDYSNGTAGVSPFAARSDHQHPGVCSEDVPYANGYTVGDALDELYDAVQELIDNPAGGDCSCDDDWAALDDYLDVLESWMGGVDDWLADVDDWCGTMNDWADSVDDELDAWDEVYGDCFVVVGGHHRIPLTALTGNINGHSGNCYVTIGNDGTLGHSENAAYNLLNTAAHTEGVTKLVTDKDADYLKLDTACKVEGMTKLLTDKDFNTGNAQSNTTYGFTQTMPNWTAGGTKGLEFFVPIGVVSNVGGKANQFKWNMAKFVLNNTGLIRSASNYGSGVSFIQDEDY